MSSWIIWPAGQPIEVSVWITFTFGAVDLDVVEEPELDDVHPELRVLDLCSASTISSRGMSQSPQADPSKPDLLPPLAGEEVDRSTKRTQLQRMHITSEWVRALSARKRTPRRRSPFETPVATTITSPGARSSEEKTRFDVLDPVRARRRRSRLGVVGQSCACSSPPRQRSAAAERTAWRVPPMPIARWSFVPRIGSRDRRGHVAVLDQLDPGARGADLLDQIVVAGAVEHERR